jgi:inhibitor of KinA
VTEFRIVPAGDAALLVELPSRIDPDISDRAVALARGVSDACAAMVRDVVVGYCSVTVYFDPLQVDAAWLEARVAHLASTTHGIATAPGAVIDVPVCYGGEYGPDLPDVAAFAGVPEHDVVAMHSAVTYRVYVVGFVPGFPYMASVDPRLAIPRRATPRTRVPAGSVAVASGQTGIYPAETPGGWHLIGRTPLKPYDESRAAPFAFTPGDRVRFHPVGPDTFERGARWP